MGIISKVTNTNVAVVTQDASRFFSFMAMVYMPSFSARFCSGADSTLTALACQHFICLFFSYTILFKDKVFSATLPYFVSVFDLPFFMA
jgi:hypothetical protein